MDDGRSNEVQSARTALAVLETLRELDGATLTEVTAAFDLSKSSVHNYLRTLERDGYVVEEDGRYRPGLRLLDVAGYARHRERVFQVARPELEGLAEGTGETANLLVERGGRGIYLHRAHGEDSVATDTYVGQRVYLHNTALGKAILAHLPAERVDEIVETHGLPTTTDETIADREALAAELETVRERGVAFDSEERVRGLRCVAAPIVPNDGTVAGAISVSGPTSRLDDDRLADVADRLERAVNVVELGITYT